MTKAVESAFALLLTKVTKPPVSGDGFLNMSITGVNKNYVPYLALKQRRGEKTYDETDNQWYDWSRLTGS